MTCGNRATLRPRRHPRGVFRAARIAALLGAPLLVLLCMLVARAQPREVMTADNPLYLKWSKFKPGTMIKYRIDSDRDGTQQALETSETLLEFLPGKAVVEIKTAMESHGARIDISAVKQEIPEHLPHPPSGGPADRVPVTLPTTLPATGLTPSTSAAASEPAGPAATFPVAAPPATATATHSTAPASLPAPYTTGPATLPRLLPITFAPPAFFDAADPVSMLEEAMSVTFPGLRAATHASTHPSTATAASTTPSSEPAESEIDGEESLVINGHTFLCHVVEKVLKTGDIVSRTKTWTTNEVPGGLIRMESNTSGPAKTQTVLRLIDFAINR